MTPKIPATQGPAQTTLRTVAQQASGTSAKQPFPQVKAAGQPSGPQEASFAQTSRPSDLLTEINRPYAELEKLEQQVLERLRSLEAGGGPSAGPEALRQQTTELLWIQMRVSRAALAVQLSAKTIEMTTTGINTLARTQT